MNRSVLFVYFMSNSRFIPTNRFENLYYDRNLHRSLDFARYLARRETEKKKKENLNGSDLYFHLLKIFSRWHNTLSRKLQHTGFVSFIRYSLFWIGQLRVGS